MATNGIDKLYADLGIERPKTVRSYLKDTSSFSFQAAEVMDKYRREEEQRIKDLADGKVRTSPASSLRTLTPTRRTTVPQATTKARAQVVGNGSPQPTPTPTVGSTFQALGGSLAKGAVNLVRQVATSQIAGQSILRRGLQTMFETPVLDIRKNIPEQVIGAGKKLWEQNKEEITKAQKTSPTVQGLQKAETAVKNWADVENEADITKFFAGLAESAPQSLATAIPIVGWTMLGSSAFLNGLEQAKIEAEVAGQDPNSDKVMLRALGNMGVEVGSETLFGLWKPIGKAIGGTSFANASKGFLDSVTAKLFKMTGKNAAELSAKTVWKQIARQATEEGIEELFAELGNALVLKATTDPNAPWPVASDYLLAFAGGAIMGGLFTGGRGFAELSAFKKALAKNANQTIPQLVNNPEISTALAEDMAKPEVQDALLESQLEMVRKYGERQASEVAELQKEIQRLQEPTVQQYVPTEEEMSTSGLPAEWYDQLNAPVTEPIVETPKQGTRPDWLNLPDIPEGSVQAPTSPSQTQDTSMPTQTQEAPTPAPQTAGQAFNDAPTSYIRPLSDYADRMYHETGSTMAQYLIDPTAYVDMHLDDVYMSNDPELALGQGDSKGFVFEFDTNQGLKGRVDMKKPASQQLYKQGKAEFIGRYNEQSAYKKALTAVTIKKNAMSTMSPYVAVKIKKILDTWTKTENADGSITYTKPKQTVQAQSTVQETQAPVTAPQTATAASESVPVSAVQYSDNELFAIKRYATNIEKKNPNLDGTKMAQDLVNAVKDKDFQELEDRLHRGNPESLKLFTAVTGLDTSTQKVTDENIRSLDPAAYDQRKIELTVKAQAERLTEEREQEQKLIEETKKKRVGYNGKSYSFENFVKQLISEGFTTIQMGKGAIPVLMLTKKDGAATLSQNFKTKYEKMVVKELLQEAQEQIPTQAQPIPPKPTITQEQTVKVGSRNLTKAQIQATLAKLNKRLENPLNDADRQEISQNIAKWNKVLLKFEQKVAEPLTQSIEEMVAEQGKKEASAEAAQGIVATGYAQSVATAAQGQAKPWRNIESQETQERIDAAFDPKTQAGWSEKLKDLIRKIQLNVFSGGVPVSPKYGDFRIKYREVGISWQTANKEASSIVTGIYNHAGRSKQELLTRSILYADMMESITKGNFTKSYSDIFGINSEQQVIDLYNATQTELNKPENQLAKEAFEMRKNRLKAVREPLMDVAKRCNVDLSRLANYDDYMTHMVLQYSDEFNGIQGKRKKGKAIEYKGRQGSPKDYITNPVITDFLIIKKMIQDTRKFELYETAKREDKSATLPLNKDGDWIIPENYAELDPSMLGIKGIENVLSKQAIMINANQAIQDAGWLLTDPRAKHILSEAREKANRYTMVVPSDMVYAIEKMNQPYNTASKFGQKMQNIWKYSKIRIPGRVWKYNLRNMYGDIDAALMLRPSAIAWVPKSMYQLYQYYYKGRVVDPELLHYIKRNGLITGEARVNMRTFKDIKGLTIYEEKNAKTLGIKGIKKLWSMLTMETFTDFREQILRYATYRSVYSEISKNKTGLPTSYMASVKKEIKSITDIRDRAAKLANDVIGAYDDVSIFGKYMADRIMPFYRFYEVNMKRYFRMTMNTFRYDPDLMASQGSRFAKQAKQFGKWGAFTTYKVAKTMIGLGIFQGLMLTLFNNLFAGDDEDKLPEDVKRKPHLTIPGWVFGDDNLHYISDLGSFSEFLSYFGVDYGIMNDIKDMATGRLDVNDYLKNVAKSSLFDVVTGSMPGVQLVIAALGGVTLYPDPTKPVQIKDTLEYIADQAGMKDEYKAIAGLPMPEGQYSQQFIQRIFKEITPGEAAVWDAYDLVNKFRQLNNLGEQYSTKFDYSTETGKRHLAAYNYKVAIKMKDKEAAEKYLAEYIAYGGTGKKFDSVIKYWYPAAGLKEDEKVAFEQWLSEDDEDWTTYANANAFIDSLVTEAGIGKSQMPSE